MLIQKSQIVKEGLYFSLQVRYFLATVMGKVRLPSHENMMASIEEEEKELKAEGEPERHYHIIGFKQVSIQNTVCVIFCAHLTNLEKNLRTILTLPFYQAKNFVYYCNQSLSFSTWKTWQKKQDWRNHQASTKKWWLWYYCGCFSLSPYSRRTVTAWVQMVP